MKTAPKHEVTTFWVTKYALTKGLFQIQAEYHVGDDGTAYASQIGLRLDTQHFLKIGTDATQDEAEAKAIANKMLDRKINSLKKQIEKLSKTRF